MQANQRHCRCLTDFYKTSTLLEAAEKEDHPGEKIMTSLESEGGVGWDGEMGPEEGSHGPCPVRCQQGG